MTEPAEERCPCGSPLDRNGLCVLNTAHQGHSVQVAPAKDIYCADCDDMHEPGEEHTPVGNRDRVAPEPPTLGMCKSLHGDVPHIHITEGLNPCIDWTPEPPTPPRKMALTEEEKQAAWKLAHERDVLSEPLPDGFESGEPSPSPSPDPLAELLKKHGKYCPKCHSGQITSGNSVPLNHRCLSCGHTFTDSEAIIGEPGESQPRAEGQTADQWMRANKRLLPGPLSDSDWQLIAQLLETYVSSFRERADKAERALRAIENAAKHVDEADRRKEPTAPMAVIRGILTKAECTLRKLQAGEKD